MPELMLLGTVSSKKLLEIGIHSLRLLFPLLNVLRIASLDSLYLLNYLAFKIPVRPIKTLMQMQ